MFLTFDVATLVESLIIFNVFLFSSGSKNLSTNVIISLFLLILVEPELICLPFLLRNMSTVSQCFWFMSVNATPFYLVSWFTRLDVCPVSSFHGPYTVHFSFSPSSSFLSLFTFSGISCFGLQSPVGSIALGVRFKLRRIPDSKGNWNVIPSLVFLIASWKMEKHM